MKAVDGQKHCNKKPVTLKKKKVQNLLVSHCQKTKLQKPIGITLSENKITKAYWYNTVKKQNPRCKRNNLSIAALY